MTDYDDPRYHSDPKGMLGTKTAKELEENCGNCGYLVWHDQRIQYMSDGIHRLATIPNPTTGSCTHVLMKRHKKCRDLKMSECLFWKAAI